MDKGNELRNGTYYYVTERNSQNSKSGWDTSMEELDNLNNIKL